MRLVVVLLLPAACGAPRAVDVRQEIAGRNAQLMAAFERADGPGLAALYAEDGQLIPPNSEFVAGREEIRDFWQGAFAAGAARLELESAEARATGDTAWEVGRYNLADRAGNSLDKGKYLVVWRKIGGSWYLYRDSWNTSRPPRRAAPPAEAPASAAAPAA